MSRALTFHVPDEIYEAIRQVAARSGRPLEEVALEWLTRYSAKPGSAEAEQGRTASFEQLRRHAGVVDSGASRSADQESLEADLSREHEGPHEDVD